MPKDRPDSRKAQQTLVSALTNRNSEQTSADPADALKLMTEQLDRTRKVYERKIREYEQLEKGLAQKSTELQAWEKEMIQRQQALGLQEASIIEREETIDSLEKQIEDLTAQLDMAKPSTHEAEDGGRIDQPYVNLQQIQSAHEADILNLTEEHKLLLAEKDAERKQAVERAIAQKEQERDTTVTAIEAMYRDELEKADGRVRAAEQKTQDAEEKLAELEELLAQKPGPVSPDLETTIPGMPSPIRDDISERPTRQPGRKEKHMNADDIYRQLAARVQGDYVGGQKGRGSRLFDALRNKGMSSADANEVIHDLLKDDIIRGDAYELIEEKAKETEEKILELRREKEAITRRREELSNLERRAREIEIREDDQQVLAEALDRKETRLLDQESTLTDLKQLLTEGKRYFKTVDKAVRELVLDCHNRINEYQERVESLVKGPRNIGARGAMLVLLPAYSMNLLKYPRDEVLTSMIENETRPLIYFRAGEAQDPHTASRLSGNVPDDATYITGKSDDGTYYVAARGRTEGGTAVAQLAAWGIQGDEAGALPEESQEKIERAAYSIMVKSVMPDYRSLHSYIVKWSEIANNMQKIEEHIEKD